MLFCTALPALCTSTLGRACAGYVYGAVGSNDCPSGSVRITTEAACRTAATAEGKTVGSFFVDNVSFRPRGCYLTTFPGDANFNTHGDGGGGSGSLLLCAVGTAGATPP